LLANVRRSNSFKRNDAIRAIKSARDAGLTDVARFYRFFRTGLCGGLIGRGTGGEYTGDE
jgi:hypothetical protein